MIRCTIENIKPPFISVLSEYFTSYHIFSNASFLITDAATDERD
jgi:hypothetical protein